MKKLIFILLATFPLFALCGDSKKYEELLKGFKEFQVYSNLAIGVWDCVSLSNKDVVSVLSLQPDHVVYYNALDKYYFSLKDNNDEKRVTLFESGLKAINQIKHSTMTDELEFDYSSRVVSFKPFASTYGNFSNYQCTKRK
ncbi:hypothetical protein OMR72_004587 [Vibrio parahaemolyticus]|nr:hypothetical protein [Vibrio parahaemolyticus]ELC9718995.1 hypothetical protein [Vibrio vulnificus]EGQ8541446.1 hypothetical protein [Vibrio parahaemolyticus]EHW0641114.1 hypothetical protein [Vibrio parahaemolyticus]EHZ2741999.1 hypothetical protein [Vibrio parahaemolyticus]EIJ2225987.1 hypothetical protein [Vibrio parahaemolyticus]